MSRSTPCAALSGCQCAALCKVQRQTVAAVMAGNLHTWRQRRAARRPEDSICLFAALVLAACVGITGCNAESNTDNGQPAAGGASARQAEKGISKNSGTSGTSDASKSTGNEAASSVARGQRLLAQYQCGSCHAIPDVPASRRINGPSLEAFGKRSYIAGRLPNSEGTLAQWIMSPQSLVPDSPMPNMGASLADARDMAAYLGALQ